MIITQRRFLNGGNRTASTVLSFLLILLAGSGMLVMAQAPAIPDRGISSLGSYSVSNIENINLSNGNLGLRIPLASLPPMAGGKLSWTLNAYYNSKLVNTHLRDVADSSGTYQETTLQLANEGGWKIGYRYSIRFQNLDEEYQINLPDPNDPNYFEFS